MLTKKGKYGLKAMVHLAGVAPGEPVQAADIAMANEIPKKFLDAILGELRLAGLVHSKKGRGGGFVLAKKPSEVMVGQIVRTLDGAFAPIACASKIYYRRCDDCVSESQCHVRLMMVEVRNAIVDVLDHRSLEAMRALPSAVQALRPKRLARASAAANSPAKTSKTVAVRARSAAAKSKKSS
jgi:Rrf2 family protein